MTTTSISATQSEHEGSGLGPVGLRFRSILVATDCCSRRARLRSRWRRDWPRNSTPSSTCCMRSCLDSMAVDTAGAVPELGCVDLAGQPSDNLHKYVEHIPESANCGA